MSVSIPSQPAYVVDVPSAQIIAARFSYNFFVHDESVNDESDNQLLQKAADRSITLGKLPRFVTLKIEPASSFSDPTQHLRSDSSDMISNNLGKIISEDHFTDSSRVSLNFEPLDFEEKLFSYVSSSLLGMPQTSAPGSVTSRAEALAHASDVPVAFISAVLGQKKFDGRAKTDSYQVPVSMRAQFDAKVVASAIGTSLSDPLSTYNDDFGAVFDEVSRKQAAAVAQSKHAVLSQNEYSPAVQYIDISYGDESKLSSDVSTQVVGYVIYKNEVNGSSVTSCDPIVIENPRLSSYVDTRVKYGTTYAYKIVTVAKVKYVVQVQTDSGDTETALATFLISSKPSQTQYVSTAEFVSPPPPADLSFVWDYGTSELNVYWCLPPNAQRDVKKFQVFRRSTVTEPFELVALYDFDDSDVKYFDVENSAVPAEKVIKLTSPNMRFVDEDFTTTSKYIYALGCVDAHGMSSCYSQQFEVSFDRFKNRLNKRLVAGSGAPKPFPNFTLDSDFFADSIVKEGKKKVTLAFAPDALSYVDDAGKQVPIVSLGDTPSKYKFQFLNTDVQKQRVIDVSIVDRRTQHGDPTSTAPAVSLNNIAAVSTARRISPRF